jgi:hypothetical protein
MSIFWGADTRTAWEPIFSHGRVYILPFGFIRNTLDNMLRGLGSPLKLAGSHESHHHGIAVEELPFFG